MTTSNLALEIEAMGRSLTPALFENSIALYKPLHEQAPFADIAIARDLVYGPHERHRLDVFTPAGRSETSAARPILVFVHGGGFVRGEKSTPGSPFYDNVGAWAVRNGLIGVTITYRLAPEYRWPAGAEDLAAVISWLREHAREYGGDSERIVLSGQSAGGAHVASYVAAETLHPAPNGGIAGAIVMSGIFDNALFSPTPLNEAYFGTDRGRYGTMAALPGLLTANIPLLFTISEYDGVDFERQFVALLDAWLERHGHLPRFAQFHDHNHISPILELGLARSLVSDELRSFIASLSQPALAGTRRTS